MADRAALGDAFGKIIFLKLSQEQRQELFQKLPATPDWKSIAHFTRQALRSVGAAQTLSTHFVEQMAVLQAALDPQMFLGGAQMCTADVVCYIALTPAMLAFDDDRKWALCTVSRWFDHMQHLVAAMSPPAELACGPMVTFNYSTPDTLPTIASVLTPLVGTAGGDGAVATGGAGAAAEGPAASAAEKTGKKEKKEKKEKEKKEKAPPPAEPEAGSSQSDVSKLDIRVGLILSAERHPEAEKLYVEKVDLGEAAPRTVVSGLVDYMPIETLVNRRCLLVCNLKPAKMRGIESAAMVLGASDEAHTKVELLTPPEACAVGDRISFAGFEGEPLQPASKKDWEAVRKAWEAAQPDFNTSDERVARYREAPFGTANGACIVATIAGGKIK